jgi:hypothetical protein
MPASYSATSLEPGRVEDFEAGSSPAATSTPPLVPTPCRLACRKASPERSTPGPLPYHMPMTPSWRRSGARLFCWLPHTAVAARSSLTPGTQWMSCSASSGPLRCSVWSKPPSGEPG